MEQQPARPKQDTLVANNNVPVKQPAPAPAALALEKLQFVQQVTSFGVYEQLPASWITPGAEMLLYVEVRNFTSQKINDQYQTNLASRMMIENPQGDVIAKLDFDTMQDASESQRKDFFCRFNFELPPSLVVGQKYVLRLLVRDLTGNQTAQQTLEFTPTSP